MNYYDNVYIIFNVNTLSNFVLVIVRTWLLLLLYWHFAIDANILLCCFDLSVKMDARISCVKLECEK